MKYQTLRDKCGYYMDILCRTIPERSVGSEGNRTATRFFRDEVSSLGWSTESSAFQAIDWKDGGARLQAEDKTFDVLVSPYSPGCEATGELIGISRVQELIRMDLQGRIVLLHGEIAVEQLMPKNFVFYNPEEHKQIIALLESKCPRAIIAATGRNAALAGGVYPFPLIEDGDFDIPSVYMTEEEGMKLLPFAGRTVELVSRSRRIPGKGYNVVARKGKDPSRRIVVTAHIDAKKGTPGAIDNATGVSALLLLAGLMADYDQKTQIEIVALNGEDYFSVPGQMLYLEQNSGSFHEIVLNVNIDGMGYKEGNTAYSFYGLPGADLLRARKILNGFAGMSEGVQWAQGDHGIFIQNGCPAIALSSVWFTENISSQEITHTPADHIGIADCARVAEAAAALNVLLRSGQAEE